MPKASAIALILGLLALVAAVECLANPLPSHGDASDDPTMFEGRELLQSNNNKRNTHPAANQPNKKEPGKKKAIQPAAGGRHLLKGPGTKPKITKPTVSTVAGNKKQQGSKMIVKQPRRALLTGDSIMTEGGYAGRTLTTTQQHKHQGGGSSHGQGSSHGHWPSHGSYSGAWSTGGGSSTWYCWSDDGQRYPAYAYWDGQWCCHGGNWSYSQC